MGYARAVALALGLLTIIVLGGCGGAEAPTSTSSVIGDAGRTATGTEGDAGASQPTTYAVARVATLRRDLVAEVHAYADSLAVRTRHAPESALPPTQSRPLAAARVDELRGELSRETIRAIETATSGEVEVAVRRAAVESTLEGIHAYERSLGVGQQPLTTECSVLSDADLTTLRERAHLDVAELEVEAQRYANAERPPTLEHRTRELRALAEALDREVTARAAGERPVLRPIRDGVSVNEARRSHPAIDAAERSAKVFEGKLRMQIALRRHWSPRDASLESVERTMSTKASDATRADAVAARVKANTAARPPPPSPDSPPPPSEGPPRPPSTGPPSPPSAPAATPSRPSPTLELRARAITEDVRGAVWNELDSVVSRDPVAIAGARARQVVGTDWVNRALGIDGVPVTRMSTLHSEELLDLRGRYAEWHNAVAAEYASTTDAVHRAEINEASAAIQEIDGELAGRHLPVRTPRPTPDDLAEVTVAPGRRAELATYDRRYAAAVAREEAVQLEIQANRFRPVPDTRLMRARHAALARSLRADASALHEAWQDLQAQERSILVTERGAAVADRAARIKVAKASIADASVKLTAELEGVTDAGTTEAIREQLAPMRLAATGGKSSIADALQHVERIPAVATTKGGPPEIALFADPTGPARGPRIDYIEPPPRPGASAPDPVPEAYGKLFPEGADWTRNVHDTVVDPRRAPGGVVIDATIPDELAHRIERAVIDPVSGAVRVRIGGRWMRVEPALDAAAARASWAFVRDGRVAAADVRPLALPELLWLAKVYTGVPLRQLTAGEQRTFHDDLRLLTSANLNPAVVETTVGLDLLLADLVIFDLLPAANFALEGDSERYGLDVRGLWEAFGNDRKRILFDPAFEKMAFTKSLLVIKTMSARLRGGSLAISAEIEPGLFALPIEGSSAAPAAMMETTTWLRGRVGAIRRRFACFERVAQFAALVGLFKTLEQRHIPHNLNVLVGVVAEPTPTPRVFCRSADTQRCDRNKLARRLEGADRDGP